MKQFAATTIETGDRPFDRWDANAPTRLLELRGSGDPAYRSLINIVTAKLAELLPTPLGAHSHTLLDIGSGLGFLAVEASRLGYEVVAVEPSAESHRIAVDEHEEKGVSFVCDTLEGLTRSSDATYDALVANMTLHAVPHLVPFMESAAAALKPSGFFVATIPNPETYLQSRGDIQLTDVDLRTSCELEVLFRIHGHSAHPAKVLYYHRPPKDYIETALAAGLVVRDYSVPNRVGIGKPRDIAVITFSPIPR